MTFGENVKKARKERGLTQGELADIMGFKSIASVSKYEQSDEVPRRKVAQKFADALGVSVSELLTAYYTDEEIRKFNTQRIQEQKDETEEYAIKLFKSLDWESKMEMIHMMSFLKEKNYVGNKES